MPYHHHAVIPTSQCLEILHVRCKVRCHVMRQRCSSDHVSPLKTPVQKNGYLGADGSFGKRPKCVAFSQFSVNPSVFQQSAPLHRLFLSNILCMYMWVYIYTLSSYPLPLSHSHPFSLFLFLWCFSLISVWSTHSKTHTCSLCVWVGVCL